MSEIAKTLKLTDEEAVLQVIKGLEELGAIHKSHNKNNIYIQIRRGSLLDNEGYISKAKKTSNLLCNRVLKVEFI